MLEHGVDERRFAVIDVGDDGDVAEVLSRFGHGGSKCLQGRVLADGGA